MDQNRRRDALVQKFFLSRHSVAHFGSLTENVDFSPSSTAYVTLEESHCFSGAQDLHSLGTSDWPLRKHSNPLLSDCFQQWRLQMLNSHCPAFLAVRDL